MITTYILKKYTWIISHHHSLSTEIHLHIFMRLQKMSISSDHIHSNEKRTGHIHLTRSLFSFGLANWKKNKVCFNNFLRVLNKADYLHEWIVWTIQCSDVKKEKKRERNHHLSKYVPDKLFFGKIVMPIPNRSLWICNNVSSAGVVVWSRTT